MAAAVAAKAGLDPADIVVTVEGASIKYKITMVGAKAYDAVVAMKDDIFSKEGVKRLFGFEAVDVPKLASRRVKKKKLAAALQNPTAGSRGNFPGAMPVSGVEGMISVPDTVATIEMPVLGPPTFVLPASAGTSAVYCPPNYCDEQGLTKDLCWDGKPRRQVGDKCCECPELPIADGTPRPPEPVVPVTGATITAPVVMDGVDMPNPPIADGLVICPPGTTLKNNGCVGTGTAVVACPPGMAINTELNKCEPMIMDGLPPNGGNPAPGEVVLPGEPVVLDGMGGGPFAGRHPSVNPMTGAAVRGRPGVQQLRLAVHEDLRQSGSDVREIVRDEVRVPAHQAAVAQRQLRRTEGVPGDRRWLAVPAAGDETGGDPASADARRGLNPKSG